MVAALPQVGVVHHVHLGTWDMLLPRPFHLVGHAVERHLVPLAYRRRTLLTAAPSARDEIVRALPASTRTRIAIAPHGVDDRFSPGRRRAPRRPLVVAVARLMPQKGISDLIARRGPHQARPCPTSRSSIVGDGPHRARFERRARRRSAATAGSASPAGPPTTSWSTGTGGRGWSCSASRREGFGLTLTEAAACGTPVVATRIPGHVDAVAEGRSGLLANGTDELGDELARLLLDDELRAKMGAAALEHAEAFRWEASASALLHALADDADRRRRR